MYDCSPIQWEVLDPASRNELDFLIRQTPAPGDYYYLAITFPIELDYDRAGNSANINYTCSVVSGAEGWTLVTTTMQNMTSTSVATSLQPVNCILSQGNETKGGDRSIDGIYALILSDIPKYVDHQAPECHFLRPILSTPIASVQIVISTGYPNSTIVHIESFNISIQILSYVPYLATAVPTGGMTKCE